MTELCEIKSVAFYRNSTNSAIFVTAKKVESSELISAKIVLAEIPSCILEKYLYITTGACIGKHTYNDKIGRDFVKVEIDKYQIVELTNYQKTETFSPIQCAYIKPKLSEQIVSQSTFV